MKVTHREHYGLRAMVELAWSYGGCPLTVTEIAEAGSIPAGYLEQLMARLRRAGLVKSTRGSHGGYVLATPPEFVTVGEVLKALEGLVTVPPCAVQAPQDHEEPHTHRASRLVWQRLQQRVADVLNSTTLADLCRVNGLGEFTGVESGLVMSRA